MTSLTPEQREEIDRGTKRVGNIATLVFFLVTGIPMLIFLIWSYNQPEPSQAERMGVPEYHFETPVPDEPNTVTMAEGKAVQKALNKQKCLTLGEINEITQAEPTFVMERAQIYRWTGVGKVVDMEVAFNGKCADFVNISHY